MSDDRARFTSEYVRDADVRDAARMLIASNRSHVVTLGAGAVTINLANPHVLECVSGSGLCKVKLGGESTYSETYFSGPGDIKVLNAKYIGGTGDGTDATLIRVVARGVL